MITEHLTPLLGYIRIQCAAPEVQPGAVITNVALLEEIIENASNSNVDLLVFPELAISGYTIGDLVRMPDLLQQVRYALLRIAERTANKDLMVVVGMPLAVEADIFNVAAFVQNGQILAFVPKTFLPNTQEFYDGRWFTSGATAECASVQFADQDVPFGTDLLIASSLHSDVIVAAEICEDLWSVMPPSQNSTLAGATIVVNLSASNELVGKAQYRRSFVQTQSARTYSVYAYASAGPNESTTDTVYGGHCMIAECGELLVESELLSLAATTSTVDVNTNRCLADRRNSTSYNQLQKPEFRRIEVPWILSHKTSVHRRINPLPFVPSNPAEADQRCSEIFKMQATALAVRMKRSGVGGFVVGISGGLDSTLALLVCIEAAEILGKPLSTIHGISMPGFGTSERTRANAKELSGLGFGFTEISIEASVRQHFADISHDEANTSVVFENAQARERTQILMDLANMKNALVVGTGDMSEIALGWSTYNADHMSMYNVNSGVPKTLVKHLIKWYANNKASEEIEKILLDVLDTPISPELQPVRVDGSSGHNTEDLLGPYEVHDFFLYHFLRLHEPIQHIATLSMLAFTGKYTPHQLVDWLEVFITRFVANQFKRSCMPDGVKIGTVALSPRADLRMPSDASAEIWLQELEQIRTRI